MREEDGSDGAVVGDDIGLREAGVGVEDLVQVRQRELTLADPDERGRRRAHALFLRRVWVRWDSPLGVDRSVLRSLIVATSPPRSFRSAATLASRAATRSVVRVGRASLAGATWISSPSALRRSISCTRSLYSSRYFEGSNFTESDLIRCSATFISRSSTWPGTGAPGTSSASRTSEPKCIVARPITPSIGRKATRYSLLLRTNRATPTFFVRSMASHRSL